MMMYGGVYWTCIWTGSRSLERKNPLHVLSGTTTMEHFSKSQLYKQTTPSISYWEWNKYNRQMQSPFSQWHIFTNSWTILWMVAKSCTSFSRWFIPWFIGFQPVSTILLVVQDFATIHRHHDCHPPEKFRALPSSSPWPLHTIPAWCTQR